MIKEILKKRHLLNSIKSGIPPNRLLRILETFEQRFEGEDWKAIKNYFCDKELLPLARKQYKSAFWMRKSRAARIFLLSFEDSDFNSIYQLLQDSDFFIRMLAVSVLSKAPTYQHIEILLSSMVKEVEPARFPYRHAILKMSSASLKHVVGIYQKSEVEEMRLACLDILSRVYFLNFYPHLSKDYRSDNTQIRIFVVKTLGNLTSDQSIHDLITFLDDPAPKVRIEAIRALKRIRSEKSFEKLASLLNDPEGLVRIEAALALKSFGKKGRQFLEFQDWDFEPDAYHAARYALTLP
ncbi:MAG: HEAT repeat domain-containing protein [Chlamydiales bacterium]|nr:HEAT repeat domain-containing protein [Chlamydiales bacterium]